MKLKQVAFASPLSTYDEQAEGLLAARRASDPEAIDFFRRHHPRFRDEKIKWLVKAVPDSEVREADFSPDDARLAIARSHDFRDWPSLATHVEALCSEGSVFAFESAVESVVDGDLDRLRQALRRDPALIHARSSRICCFDPPVHRASLLHYVAANGVEHERQRTPPNAVAIARTLLEAGADADALADMYGAPCTTMSMLVSSSHPAAAGVQVPLIHLLLDFGAAIEGCGTKKWGTPLFTALAFGMSDAARALAERGARIDLPHAAGLGLVDDTARLLPSSDTEARRRALSLAAQHGHAETVGLLLDAGTDPDRYNPESNHPHTTPLHQAVLGGHEAVVRLLVRRGARLDIRDTIWDGTPLGWVLYGGGKAKAEMAECLRSLGAEE